MRTILDVYREIYESNESKDHKDLMREMAIEIGQIGQRIKMGRVRDSDGDRLISAAKTIEKEYINNTSSSVVKENSGMLSNAAAGLQSRVKKIKDLQYMGKQLSDMVESGGFGPQVIDVWRDELMEIEGVYTDRQLDQLIRGYKQNNLLSIYPWELIIIHKN